MFWVISTDSFVTDGSICLSSFALYLGDCNHDKGESLVGVYRKLVFDIKNGSTYIILTGDSGELYEEFEDTKDELEELDEDNQWARRHCYPNRIRNQIELIEILRKDYGIRDSILIWMSW
jgi:hypothetical protein